MPERVFIGLGGNLGDVPSTLKQAIACISAVPGVAYVAHSGFYRTPPWGGVEQPDYINAVLELDAELEPQELLDRLLDVERQYGRKRAEEQHWGPRTLDCDILLFGDHVLHGGSLTIPHPRMAERAFVLVPLAELDGDLTVPGQGSVRSLLERLAQQPIQLIAER
ncbi:MAG: 2-amino-4-hydroxy-6-hydroxymethyldihydropteridine diphosphokinase [Arenimonas sp.]|nr:2-amino-4-hydroxy-6-hydroxymethyldihydropteridine diphosphokinase [Arenimonas sp.]MBP7917056.1 2-amino-4-hydroxy-6-hydroxymethyldihydropteridine diphosphokinase [Arenimonas sp.]